MRYDDEHYFQIVNLQVTIFSEERQECRSSFNRYLSKEDAKQDLDLIQRRNPDFADAYIEEVETVRTKLTF